MLGRSKICDVATSELNRRKKQKTKNAHIFRPNNTHTHGDTAQQISVHNAHTTRFVVCQYMRIGRIALLPLPQQFQCETKIYTCYNTVNNQIQHSNEIE